MTPKPIHHQLFIVSSMLLVWHCYGMRKQQTSQDSEFKSGNEHNVNAESIKLISADDMHARQSRALNTVEAESYVLNQLGLDKTYKRSETQPAPPTFTRSEQASVSTTGILRQKTTSLMACLTVEVSLTAAGCPGCVVGVGLSAELVTDVCSSCYRWRLEALLDFSIGVSLIGIHVWIGVSVAGRIEPEEVPCLNAKETMYCEIQDIFLSEKQLQDDLWSSRCHTSNPFTVIMAYIEVQLRGVRSFLAGIIEKSDFFKNTIGTKWLDVFSIESAMAQALNESEKLSEYPDKFILAPPTDPAEQKSHKQVKRTTKGSRETAVRSRTSYYYTTFERWDCKENVLEEHTGVTLSQCKKLCENYRGGACTLVVIGRQGKTYEGKCWLKSKYTQKKDPTCRSSTSRDCHFLRRTTSSEPVIERSASMTSTPTFEVDDEEESQEHAMESEGWLTIRPVRGWVRDGTVSPSPYVKIDFQSQGANLDTWQSSYVLNDAAPVWDEATSVPLHIFAGGAIDITIKLKDISSGTMGGAALRTSLPWLVTVVHTGGNAPEQCRLPCRRQFPIWEYDNTGITHVLEETKLSTRRAGLIELDIRWMKRPSLWAHYSLKPEVVRPLWAAYDSFNAKLPRYADQIMELVTDPAVQDSARNAENVKEIPTEALNGIGLARWTPPRQEDPDLTPGEREEKEAKRIKALKARRKKGFCSNSKINAAWSDGSQVVNMIHVLRKKESEDVHQGLVRLLGENNRVLNGYDVNFYVELAMSTANLFIRAISDIHAMFSVYFADSAAWNGECSALPPEFTLLEEDSITTTTDAVLLGMVGAASKRSVRRNHNVRSARLLSTRRLYPSGRAHGRQLKDENNPWCTREWTAGSPALSEQLEFAVRDPPTRSKDQSFIMQGRDNATIYAQLWCEVARQWRIQPETRQGHERQPSLDESSGTNLLVDASDLAKKADAWANTADVEGVLSGRMLRFESSCRRLQPREHKIPGTSKTEVHYVWEYREDCEVARISPAFLTIFRSFFAQMNIHFARIGTRLEEALQCAQQNLPRKARQFPRDPKGESAFYCDGPQQSRDRAINARYHFLSIVHELRTFLIRIGAPLSTQTSKQEVRQTVMGDWMAGLSKAMDVTPPSPKRGKSDSGSRGTNKTLAIIEKTGAIRFVLQEFVNAERLREPWNHVTTRLQRVLTSQPWALTQERMKDVISAIAETDDLTKFRGAMDISDKVDKTLDLPFDEDPRNLEGSTQECKNLKDTDSERLLKCWDLLPIELESVRAAAYLRRLRARKNHGWVNVFIKANNYHWKYNSGLMQAGSTKAYESRHRTGVWLSGKAKLARFQKGTTSRASPKSTDCFVRILVTPAGSIELQYVSVGSEQAHDLAEWSASSKACQQTKQNHCIRVPISKGNTFMVAKWPGDFVEFKEFPNGRALKLEHQDYRMYLLLVPPEPPAGVVLTVPEQLQAQQDTQSIWFDELQRLNSPERSEDKLKKLIDFWVEKLPTKTRSFEHRMIKDRVAKHIKYDLRDLLNRADSLGAAAAIASAHDQFWSRIKASSQIFRHEIVEKTRETLNNLIVTTLFNGGKEIVSQEEVKELVQQGLVSTREAELAWRSAFKYQLDAFDKEPRLKYVRRRLIDTIVQDTLAQRGIKRPDDTSYVVFAGKALISVEEFGDDKKMLCCCKTREIVGTDWRAKRNERGDDWCNNFAAKRGDWPVQKGSTLEQSCCKRKLPKVGKCPSFGYTKRAPSLQLCRTIKDKVKDGGGSLSISPQEHAVRLVAQPRGVFLQFLTSTIDLIDTIDWETSAEACDQMGHAKCRSLPLSCRFEFAAFMSKEKSVIQGVEKRFQDVESITLLSDHTKMRLVPLREGSFDLNADFEDRWIDELHRVFATKSWLYWLNRYSTQAEGNGKCPPLPGPRPALISDSKLKIVARGSLREIINTAKEVIQAWVGASVWDPLAFLLGELRDVLAHRKMLQQSPSAGSGVDVVSPFETAAAASSEHPCCALALTDRSTCRTNEQFLPMSCTVLYTIESKTMSKRSSARNKMEAEGSMINLGNKGWSLLPTMDMDFHSAFAYFRQPAFGGEEKPLLLTGLFWSALPEVLRDFTSVVGLAARKKMLKRHLAYAVRQNSLATGKSVKLPYPPIRYESSVAIKLHGGLKFGEWQGLESPCQAPGKWQFGYRHRTIGNSWTDTENSEHCIMGQGFVSVLRLSIYIERCWHLTAGTEAEEDTTTGDRGSDGKAIKKWAEEPEWYDVWRFDIFSVVIDGAGIIATTLNSTANFVKNLFKGGWSAITPSIFHDTPDFLSFKSSDDNAIMSTIGKVSAVALATAILSSPGSFFGAAALGGAAMLGALGSAVGTIATSVMSQVRDLIVKWASDFAAKTGLQAAADATVGALKAGWEWVKEHVRLDNRNRECLRIGMTVSRNSEAAASAPWNREFEMHYLTYQTLEMAVTVPGVVRVQTILAFVTDLNLSGYLTMLYNFIMGEQTSSRLEACMSCFACGATKCDVAKGQGRIGTGETFAFCADDRVQKGPPRNKTEGKTGKKGDSKSAKRSRDGTNAGRSRDGTNAGRSRDGTNARRSRNPDSTGLELVNDDLVFGDRCMKWQQGLDRCKAPPGQTPQGNDKPPVRLIEIIEECQSLVPVGASMS